MKPALRREEYATLRAAIETAAAQMGYAAYSFALIIRDDSEPGSDDLDISICSSGGTETTSELGVILVQAAQDVQRRQRAEGN